MNFKRVVGWMMAVAVLLTGSASLATPLDANRRSNPPTLEWIRLSEPLPLVVTQPKLGLYGRYLHIEGAPSYAMPVLEVGVRWDSMFLLPLPGDIARKPGAPIGRVAQDAKIPFGVNVTFLRMSGRF